MISNSNIINIYTDGSCDTKHLIGGWAAVVLYDSNEIILKGNETDTTNNRMELTAVLKSIEYLENYQLASKNIKVYTDSQYVTRLPVRKDKFISNNFLTKKGNSIRNVDLVKLLLNYIDLYNIEFVKVKAHQKKDETKNYNREVDQLSRKIVRDYVKNNII